MKRDELQQHVFSTYVTLRYGVAILGVAFPLILYLVGLVVHGIDLQDSMSSYYFALAPDDLSKRGFPMRGWFVGLLFAIGVSLYLYKGFSTRENLALNLAGLCAVGVALVPANEVSSANPSVSLHGTFAVVLFLSIAFVSLACAKDTLHLLKDAPLEARYRMKYIGLGALMIASPALALVMTFLVKSFQQYVFFAEAFGVWVFASYWLVKSRELSRTSAEKSALDAT